MELSDLITLIIFLVFFVLPSVFRNLGKKKKKPFSPKKKKVSLFGRLREGIQEFVRELEKQALEAKQKQQAEQSGTVWEQMADEETGGGHPEEPPALTPVETVSHDSLVPEPPACPRDMGRPPVPTKARSKVCGGGLPELTGPPPRHPLQQAVVWSEILGRPVALRDE